MQGGRNLDVERDSSRHCLIVGPRFPAATSKLITSTVNSLRRQRCCSLTATVGRDLYRQSVHKILRGFRISISVQWTLSTPQSAHQYRQGVNMFEGLFLPKGFACSAVGNFCSIGRHRPRSPIWVAPSCQFWKVSPALSVLSLPA